MSLRSARPVVFLVSTIRSGSTLLRCLLNAHPQVSAPHELHLGGLRVTSADEYTELAVRELGWCAADLEFLLADRIYAEILAASGKRVLVDKSPSNLWRWAEIADRWPAARFLFLRRDPAAIARSIVEADDGRDDAVAAEFVARGVESMERARAWVERGYTVEYEALAARPEETLRGVCGWLHLPFAPRMLAYGRVDQGTFTYGIGDWGDRIAAGRVLPADLRRLEGAAASSLAAACAAWDYPPPA